MLLRDSHLREVLLEELDGCLRTLCLVILLLLLVLVATHLLQ